MVANFFTLPLFTHFYTYVSSLVLEFQNLTNIFLSLRAISKSPDQKIVFLFPGMMSKFGCISMIKNYPTNYIFIWVCEIHCTYSKEETQLGVIHKLRLQDGVGRWSKNVHFFQHLYHRKCQRWGVGGQEKPKSCQRSL